MACLARLRPFCQRKHLEIQTTSAGLSYSSARLPAALRDGIRRRRIKVRPSQEATHKLCRLRRRHPGLLAADLLQGEKLGGFDQAAEFFFADLVVHPPFVDEILDTSVFDREAFEPGDKNKIARAEFPNLILLELHPAELTGSPERWHLNFNGARLRSNRR